MIKNFDELKIGDEIEFEENIDFNRHKLFSDLFGDNSVIHNDRNFADKTKFNNIIGYGFMLNGFLSKLYGEYLPGGTSICIKQESSFKKPFYIGDTIKVLGKIVDKVISTKFLVIESKMYRNNNECIFTGKGIVQVLFDKREVVPLFKYDEKNIYYSDFFNKMKEIGIKKGDALFVHCDITKFGKLACIDKEFLLKNLIDVFKNLIEETGTLVMPTFSYSFCNNEIFDVENTKGIVGILNEYFRNLPNVFRTVHPIFSVAVNGQNEYEILDIEKDCFGENSIFSKLHKLNGKLVFFGADFSSCTFLHYIEQMHGIPYRYMKKFKGKIKNGNKIYDDECTFFVRYLDRNVILDTTRLEKYLLNNGLMKKTKIGSGEIKVIDAKVLYDEGFKLLDKDVYYFLKEEV